MSSNSSSRN